MNVIKSYIKLNVVKIVVGVLREIGQSHLCFFGWFICGNRWDDGDLARFDLFRVVDFCNNF